MELAGLHRLRVRRSRMMSESSDRIAICLDVTPSVDQRTARKMRDGVVLVPLHFGNSSQACPSCRVFPVVDQAGLVGPMPSCAFRRRGSRDDGLAVRVELSRGKQVRVMRKEIAYEGNADVL